jgi:tripartite-type tricarboxylate transporter receptor subunit TctC
MMKNILLVFAALALTCGAARPQTRTVKLVVPNPAGGKVDVRPGFRRIRSLALTDLPMIVGNRAGARWCTAFA